MKAGQNLLDFKEAQLSFSSHIRNPEIYPRPLDIEQRRMDIYVGLFYRNIKTFIDGAFPVLKSCLNIKAWDDLVRQFVHLHSSESPYFLEISQEFLVFLEVRGLEGLPAFALELAHYEWVELALDVAEAEVAQVNLESDQPLPNKLQTSPLALSLVYGYAVHKIGSDHQPTEPQIDGCCLIAYRQADYEIKFMESNPLTHRLLSLVDQYEVSQAIEYLYDELRQAGRELTAEQVRDQAEKILRQLLQVGVLVISAEKVA